MNLVQYAAATKVRPIDLQLALKRRGVDIGHEAVRMWLKGKRQPSHKLMDAIEAATNGKVTRYDQRPDIFGAAPKKRKATAERPALDAA